MLNMPLPLVLIVGVSALSAVAFIVWGFVVVVLEKGWEVEGAFLKMIGRPRPKFSPYFGHWKKVLEDHAASAEQELPEVSPTIGFHIPEVK